VTVYVGNEEFWMNVEDPSSWLWTEGGQVVRAT